mmetsp:Transcript_14195/g.30378  ORF Transcript_14195/g.30378 Transcript_14195/m.30378 type:complete len:220 (-) Transcript_14195:1079-1738(-)
MPLMWRHMDMQTDSITAGGMAVWPERVQVGASSLTVSVRPRTVPHMADPTTSLVKSRTSGAPMMRNMSMATVVALEVPARLDGPGSSGSAFSDKPPGVMLNLSMWLVWGASTRLDIAESCNFNGPFSRALGVAASPSPPRISTGVLPFVTTSWQARTLSRIASLMIFPATSATASLCKGLDRARKESSKTVLQCAVFSKYTPTEVVTKVVMTSRIMERA